MTSHTLWRAAGRLLCITALLPFAAPAASPPGIEVLSNRADLISGGDALVELQLPAGTDLSTVDVRIDGRDVSHRFARRPNGRVQGVVDGLATAANEMTLRLPTGEGARLTITNHPRGGPVFAGPQVTPWHCAAGALDAQCNQPATYAWQYMNRQGEMVDYDPAQPPRAARIAYTVTDDGHRVPYIVRIESGHIDRGGYSIAVLHDPDRPWTPWAPQRGWNGKLVTTTGAACGVQHGEGPVPNVVVDAALSRGFAVLSSSLLDNNQNCNMVVQAEALMMVKEHFIETYGPVRYTIGTGCSGGSITQQQVANAYPGLLDGILPQCSYPDAVTTGMEVEDCALLLDYFEHRAEVAWTPEQQVAVTGHPSLSTCSAWLLAGFEQVQNPRLVNRSFAQNCGLERREAWAPWRPGAARCSLPDYMVSVVGTREEDGYANLSIANRGVQYGLQALLDGAIGAEQFIDLNRAIGSHDVNYDWQTQRADADVEALDAQYAGGAINGAHLLAAVPMIDLRGHSETDIHLDYHSYEMRERLLRANGHHDNQAIWLSPVFLYGEPDWPVESLQVMDEWLAAVEADTRDVPLATKVAEQRPAAASDRCYDAAGHVVGDLQACAGLIAPPSANPRIVAGAPLANDILHCRLRPLDIADYPPHTFSDAQWSELQALFADGVCDYDAPGVAQVPTTPWRSYAAGPGGEPLPALPASRPL